MRRLSLGQHGDRERAVNGRALGKHNPLLKQLAKLSESSERKAQGRFLLEGVRLLEEARKAALPLEMLLYDPTRTEPRQRALVEHWQECAWEVSGEVLQRTGSAETSQGLLGVAALPPAPTSSLDDFVLVLDGVRDPGNLGALVRNAWASQVHGLVLLHCADPYSPKAVRASAGGVFHVLLHQTLSVDDLLADGLALVALTPRNGENFYTWKAPRRTAWVLGGEAAGQTPELLERISHSVTIPMAPGCESLNVAATGAIVMFERQRPH